MSGKVWVVEVGDYSARHVVKVFSTEEKATAFQGPNEEMRITEWDLDEDTDVGARLHYAYLSTKGDVLELRHRYAYNDVIAPKGFIGQAQMEVLKSIGTRIDEFMFVGESVQGTTHAQKLAAEKRQEWLRAGSPLPKTYDEMHKMITFTPFLKKEFYNV